MSNEINASYVYLFIYVCILLYPPPPSPPPFKCHPIMLHRDRHGEKVRRKKNRKKRKVNVKYQGEENRE